MYNKMILYYNFNYKIKLILNDILYLLQFKVPIKYDNHIFLYNSIARTILIIIVINNLINIVYMNVE